MDIKELIKETAAKVEQRLGELLPSEQTEPVILHKAMRYSIFAGGKRIRPLLCLEAAKACGGSDDLALNPARALATPPTSTLLPAVPPPPPPPSTGRGRVMRPPGSYSKRMCGSDSPRDTQAGRGSTPWGSDSSAVLKAPRKNSTCSRCSRHVTIW